MANYDCINLKCELRPDCDRVYDLIFPPRARKAMAEKQAAEPEFPFVTGRTELERAKEQQEKICPHYYEATDGVHACVVGRCDCEGKHAISSEPEKQEEICPDCNGKGFTLRDDGINLYCMNCRGTGKLSVK